MPTVVQTDKIISYKLYVQICLSTTATLICVSTNYKSHYRHHNSNGFVDKRLLVFNYSVCEIADG